jgi:SAM-dependent methyltransferase
MERVQSDATSWDERHRHAAAPTPRAPEPVTDRADLEALVPRSGTALDVACGTGSQALWLAGRGLRVAAIDVSPVAIAALTRAAVDRGLAGRIDARTVDLDDGLPPDPPVVDVIVCRRFRDPALYPLFVERLARGGIGVVTVLSEVGADAPGPHRAPAGELSAAFDRPELDVLHDVERDGIATVAFRRR